MIHNYEKITKVLASSLGITAEELVRSYDRAFRSDIPEICELMRLGFGDVENLSRAVITWRYFDSSKNSSDIFVLRYQGKLIGAIGAEPIKVKVGDQEYEGIRAADIVVHPEHMKQGIGAWMNLYLQNRFPVVMAMGSNENSNAMVRKLFKPMNCRHCFKILFSIKYYLEVRGFPSFVAKIISAFAVLPLTFIRAKFIKKLPSGYKVTESDNTHNFESYFNNPAYEPPVANIALRSAEFCRWRYDLNPKSHFHVLQLHQENHFVGYGVVKKDVAGKAKDWQLMDWDLLPTFRNEQHLRMLFTAAITYALSAGAQSLSVMASDSLSCSGLRQSGFSHRAVDDGFFLWAQPHVAPAVLDDNQWFLSLCDTDEAL